jgi:hypothetical protein
MKKIVLFLLMYLFSALIVAAQSGSLYENGYNAYLRRDWKNAAFYLKAYIAGKPADFVNKVFKDKVISAFNYSQAEYLQTLETASNTVQNDGVVGTVSGLSIPPPDLPKPRTHLRKMTTTDLNSVEGSWQFSIVSASGTTTPCTLQLSQSEKIVSGTLLNPAGKQMQIIGTFDAGVLVILCLTGEETTQVYTLRRTDRGNFSGSFHNEGRWPDTGTVSMSVGN